MAAVFAKAGSSTHEADMIAKRLVDSNLMGHDSHGVVRVTSYMSPASPRTFQRSAICGS